MSYRFLVSAGAVVTVMAMGLVMSARRAELATTQVEQAKPTAAAASGPRTLWGDPDLQGIWSPGYILTPLERPDEFAGREFLTDEEVASLEAAAGEAPGRDGRLAPGSREDLEGAYNDAFTGRGTEVVRTRRTSLIIDPPDGKIPPLTPEALARRAAAQTARAAATRRGPSAEETPYPVPPPDGGYPSDNPEDRVPDRCLGITLPFIRGTSGTFSRLVQSPGFVTIYYEEGHHGGAYRTIPLDGRPHLPSHIRQWLGDSVGHWEGNTLVVDTTNFTDQTSFHESRETLNLVERFTRVEHDMIQYQVTVNDAATFAKPWTIEVPLTKVDNKTNQIFESACHEGNYAMVSILAGARALEKEASK